MNWCAVLTARVRRLVCSVWSVSMLVAGCGVPAEDTAAQTDPGVYELEYVLTPVPASGRIGIELNVRQPAHLLREVRFDFDEARYDGFAGSGEVQVEGSSVRWYVPEEGGALSWTVNARNERNESGYDAWLDESWGVMRAERVIPRAVSRTRKGSSSQTTLRFDVPTGWSVVTQYRESDGVFAIDNPERRYDEPAGWMVMGRLGVRLDRVAGSRLVVAAPEDNGVRRLDMLAFLNWTLPEVARLTPSFPDRLTIVSAGEPMWRGGLSASSSLYVHADRPLISENGTSTLLHEIMHVAFGIRAEENHDWIVEGLAEYYTLEVLSRSGGLSASRSKKALESITEWAADAEVLCEDPSKGARTARAVTVFAALDREIRAETDGDNSLDDVLDLLLADDDRVDLRALEAAATDVLGRKPNALHSEALPGCTTLAAPDPEPAQ